MNGPSIPVVVCGTGEAADAAAALVRGVLTRHLPSESFIVMQRPASKSDLLLAHLSIGLHSSDWAMVAASEKSMHVRISRLRSEGYKIDAVPDAPKFGSAGPRSRVTYRLRSAPSAA